MKCARHSCLRNVRTARVVQVLLFSVPDRLARAKVIEDVDISTVVHNLKVARGTHRCIISYALSLRCRSESDFKEVELHPLRD